MSVNNREELFQKCNQEKKEKVCNDIEILKISCMIELVFPVLRQGVPSWARASFPSLLFFKVQPAFEPAEIDCFIRSISNQNQSCWDFPLRESESGC